MASNLTLWRITNQGGKMKHKYLNLNMGLVKENFVITKREEMSIWKSRGFKKVKRYPVFRYIPKSSETIMLGKPLTLGQFGLEKLRNSKVIDFSPCLGTYGMGGPGFVGLKIEGDFGIRWIVYCIWMAGEHILLDDRVLECYPNFASTYKPWISYGDDYARSVDNLRKLLNGQIIKDIQLSHDDLSITLSEDHSVTHTICTHKMSDQFPEQGGTGKKRNSYDNGSMEEYWMVIYDGTELSV